MLRRLFSSHIARPLLWGAISLAIAGILALLPGQWIQFINSVNIMHGENPADMALYWESSFLGYGAIHIITYRLGHPLRFNFIDLTLWLLSMAVPALISHNTSIDTAGFAGFTAVYLIAPLAFCIVLHLLLRPYCKSMREPETDTKP